MDFSKDRFFRNIEVGDVNACWIWAGYKNAKNYGRFPYNGRFTMAHRIIWMINFGEIPDGMCICHKCDNPSCCNPSHLFMGTTQDNVRDRVAKGRTRVGIHRGEDNFNSKVTVSDVVEIRRMKSNGIPTKQISDRFNICVDEVRNIVIHKTWAWVKEE